MADDVLCNIMCRLSSSETSLSGKQALFQGSRKIVRCSPFRSVLVQLLERVNTDVVMCGGVFTAFFQKEMTSVAGMLFYECVC